MRLGFHYRALLAIDKASGNLGVDVPKHHFLFALLHFFCRKSVDVRRDHLIHRKRSPFPYEGKALTRLKVGMTFLDELRFSLVTGPWSLLYKALGKGRVASLIERLSIDY